MKALNGQMFTDFIETPKEYVLINPTDEFIEIGYDGETRIIPPHNKVVLPHPKFSDVPHSAKDENGNFIPGTLLVKDIFDQVNENLGGAERIWNAADAIKHCLGIDTKTGVATGKYSERGLSVGPRAYTRAIIDGLKTSGRQRYEVWRLNDAEEVMRAHESKNAVRNRLGMPEVPGDESYRKAAMLLKVANARNEKLIEASLETHFSEAADVKEGPDPTVLADSLDLISFEEKQRLLTNLLKDQKVVDSNPDFYVRPLNDKDKRSRTPKKDEVVA